MGTQEVEKVVKTEILGCLPHRLATVRPQLSPPHPGGQGGGQQRLGQPRSQLHDEPPRHHPGPLGLIKPTARPSLPTQKSKLSGQWEDLVPRLLRCPWASAGGTEPLTSLISLFSPAQLAYPATQNDYFI